MPDPASALAKLLDGARRRRLLQLVVEQSGVALGAALAGSILLLVIGTQILNWYWLVLLFAGSFGFGLWRTLQRLPSRYILAQQIDSRLQLNDALSTAVNFESERPGSEEFRIRQREQANMAARSVDLGAAFPFALPKAFYAAGGIALVAIGMFAIRYGFTRSLDLRPSLVKIAFDTFFTPSDRADAKKSDLRKKIEEELQKLGINMNATDAKSNDLDPAPNSALNVTDTPDVNNSGDSDTAKSQAVNNKNERESTESGGDDKSEQASTKGSDQSGDQTPEGNDGQPQKGDNKADPKGGKQSNADNSSMMDKMKDAMSNLLNKLKMDSKQGTSKESAKSSGQQGGKSKDGKADKGQQQGKQQSGDAQNQQGQQQAQGDPSQASQGKSGDKNGEKQTSQDAKSGIGKQDGDKSAREAEQLDAMGKISEILGKRAKDMSGEVMIEVSGGKQSLKTQYSSKNATHVEAGGEISRDEVPLEYQEFVTHYFEQIRKSPAAVPAKGKSEGPAAPAATSKKTE